MPRDRESLPLPSIVLLALGQFSLPVPHLLSRPGFGLKPEIDRGIGSLFLQRNNSRQRQSELSRVEHRNRSASRIARASLCRPVAICNSHGFHNRALDDSINQASTSLFLSTTVSPTTFFPSCCYASASACSRVLVPCHICFWLFCHCLGPLLEAAFHAAPPPWHPLTPTFASLLPGLRPPEISVGGGPQRKWVAPGVAAGLEDDTQDQPCQDVHFVAQIRNAFTLSFSVGLLAQRTCLLSLLSDVNIPRCTRQARKAGQGRSTIRGMT